MELVQLDNGARVVVIDEGAVGLVGVMVSVGAGAGDDPPGQSGLAHLAEHLAFGRLADGRGYDDVVAPLAVRTDGWTELDRQGFQAIGPARALGAILDRERVRWTLGLDPDGVPEERRVIEAERALYPRPFVLDPIRAAVWPEGHPWHRAVDGGEGGEASDVVAWTHANWVPARLIVVIAGQVDRGVVGPFVEALAGATGTATRPVFGAGRSTATAWPTVPQAHPDRPALDLVARLLGGGTRNGREVGQLWVPPGSEEALRRLRVDGPEPQALADARADVDLELTEAGAGLEGRLAAAAYCVQTWGVADCVGRERAAYAAVDEQAVRRVVATWLGQ